MDYIGFRTRTTAPSGGFLAVFVRLLAVATAGIAFLAILLVGIVIVLPLLFASGAALYLYLRRRVRRTRSRPQDGIIDAEYTIIEHREP